MRLVIVNQPLAVESRPVDHNVPNVPSPLERHFGAYEVKLADALGWANLKNDALLTMTEQAGFDVLLSGDQTVRHEQI